MSTTLKDKGEIYMITSPNGKKYIGQTRIFYKNKDGKYMKHGINSRWSGHKSAARNETCNTVLARSMRKYGINNFTIKTIFICDISQLNYFEVKYIRQYNTMIPNGLNMITGGNVLSGAGNPNYGKTTSDETKEKIRLTQLGRILPESVKGNMRIAAESKVQPRRTHDTLPKYIYHAITSTYEGYQIQKCPTKNDRKFVSMKISMEEKLQLAIDYLAEVETIESDKNIELNIELPKYISYFQNTHREGYRVKLHPTKKDSQFADKSVSLEENLQNAKDYLLIPDIIVERQTDLPQYIYHHHDRKSTGYFVRNHPTKKKKAFTSMKISMEEKLQNAKNYINEI